ncbi:MAG: hypothetical protein Kow0026_25280 [Oricola sp.]
MVPVDLVKMLRKKTDHATRMSYDISRSIDMIPPALALHTSRYLEAQAEEMRNILVGLVVADCELSLRDSASKLVSRYSDMALRASAGTHSRCRSLESEI